MQLAFGAWLVAQGRRDDWICELARDASRDPRFPRYGDISAVREYLQRAGAPPEQLEILDDAELVWLRESGDRLATTAEVYLSRV